ncbi:hypothetical protein ACFYY8_02965 [Streptosporangium sp. NPDC001559]|uniref:hypothetical protein n=1 Tax=Streptosporangium sp. NPDC001559 TaxID=3366187 RepID=UPI0036E1BFAF
MRTGVRAAWIVVGGALSVALVLGLAVTTWGQIELPRAYDFVYPGSFGSSLIESRETSDGESTKVYSLAAPWVIVDVTGPVGVSVTPGTAGRLTVRQKLTSTQVSRTMREVWEKGKTLRVDLDCPGYGPPWAPSPPCRADYTLAVPPGVKVVVVTRSGTIPCPLTSERTVCRSPDAEAG